LTVCHGNLVTDDFFKTLLDSVFDAVYTVDRQGIITYWNESCARLTGYGDNEMIGQTYALTAFAYDEDQEHNTIHQRAGVTIVLETGMPGTWKGYVRRKNGQRIPIESHISPLRDNTGNTIGAVEIFRDISAFVALEEAHRQVLQMSRKDLLTGLYNRGAISELLKAEIERARRYQQDLSVVMIDIDFFKRINDRYGHDAGDKVLAKIGSILMHNLRQPDAVGRWGGEEFLVVAPGSSGAAATQLAERMRHYIMEIPAGEIPEAVTASFGAAQWNEGQTHDQLLYRADKALYEAKRTGRNRVCLSPVSGMQKP
jgi:diguanylate cyclase (GGDEF)-like protein/PAS domain S-box-containing protein